MQSNPFVEVLKIVAFSVLALGVFLVFWQSNNVEDKVTALRLQDEALADKVADLGRRVDEVRDAAAAGALARTSGSTGTPVSSSASGALDDLDKALDPSRPVGTPGRFKNLLTPDPEPWYPARAAQFRDGDVGVPFGPDPKGFNAVTENDGSLRDIVHQYVSDGPARRHYANPSLWAPSVCWRVEASPDYREYTLFFRKDVVWHAPMVDLSKYPHLAGTHRLTARDYKFTIDIIMNPQHEGASMRSYFEHCEGATLIDEWTVVVRWKKTLWLSKPYTLVEDTGIVPEFLYAYGEDGKKFPDDTVGTSFNNHFYNHVGAIGCGPYRFTAYEPGQRMVLERFEDWYGVRDGVRLPIRRQRLIIYNDAETPYLKLKAGELDFSGMRPAHYRKEVLENTDPKSQFKDGRILVARQPRPAFAYIGWKNTHPLFRQREVRKALALACNRADMCEKIFLGLYEPMASPVYPRSNEADPDLKPLPFDLKEAARLLDEAGWKVNSGTGLREKVVDGETRKFDFKLLWPTPSPEYEAMLNQYKNDLLAIGVRLEPMGMEWSVFQKKIHDREFEAMTLLWLENGWEHDFNQIWHSRQIQEASSSNMIEFSNAEVDRLSDELQEEMDVDKRISKVRRIGRILYEEQPYMFFGWQFRFIANHAHAKNINEHLYKIRPFLRTYGVWVER